eukprot:1142598-Prorocentrum_minimum.AAC.2
MRALDLRRSWVGFDRGFVGAPAKYVLDADAPGATAPTEGTPASIPGTPALFSGVRRFRMCSMRQVSPCAHPVCHIFRRVGRRRFAPRRRPRCRRQVVLASAVPAGHAERTARDAAGEQARKRRRLEGKAGLDGRGQRGEGRGGARQEQEQESALGPFGAAGRGGPGQVQLAGGGARPGNMLLLRNNITSCYRSSCANSGEGALNTQATLPLFSRCVQFPTFSRCSPLGPCQHICNAAAQICNARVTARMVPILLGWSSTPAPALP